MEQGNHYQSQDDASFDLAQLLWFLWQKKFRIVFLAALIVSAGVYYIFTLPKIYTASSTVLLGDDEKSFSLSSAMADFGRDSDAQIDTYVEFFRSRQFIGKVVDDLDLVYDSEFHPLSAGTTAEYTRDHAIRVLLSNLSLSRLGDTNLLTIMVNSTTPETATKIANHLGPAFFEFQSEMGKQKADETSKWLNEKFSELQVKLFNAEQNLQNFLVDNQLMDVNSQIEISQVEISGLLQERLAIEKALAEVSATAVQIDAAAGDHNQLMQIPWVLNNPLLVSIRRKKSAQEQRLAELSKRYKSKHHKHILAVTSLESLRNEESAMLQELIASLQQQYKTLKSRKQSISEQLGVVKKLHGELGKHELQLERMRREIESTQSLYDVFVSRLQETEILKDLGNTEQFAVVDFASVPVGPSRPRVALLSALVLMFAFLASSGFWLLLHLIADKQTRFRKLLKDNGVMLLGELPKTVQQKKKSSKKMESRQLPSKSEVLYFDAVRNLRAELMVRADGSPIRTLVVTSVHQGKYRSMLGIELAKSFSGLDKSILVDADLRGPHIGEHFDLPQLSSGLTNFISRRCSFSEASYREKGTQLSVMPSGAIPTDPLVYLSKPRFAGFVKKLGVLFERVIIESPPVNGFSDTLVISKSVDAVLLLCDLEVNESADLVEAIRRLQESGVPLLGVVFENAKNIKSRMPKRSASRNLIKKVIRY